MLVQTLKLTLTQKKKFVQTLTKPFKLGANCNLNSNLFWLNIKYVVA
jgi:hypothetical protein